LSLANQANDLCFEGRINLHGVCLHSALWAELHGAAGSAYG
jgi:hypothetical protein